MESHQATRCAHRRGRRPSDCRQPYRSRNSARDCV